jgi:hypothetical protein
LQNATFGSTITFFPVPQFCKILSFKRTKFDAKFVAAVPALEIFTKTSVVESSFGSYFAKTRDKKGSRFWGVVIVVTEDGKVRRKTPYRNHPTTEALLGTNYWRQQAEEGPGGPDSWPERPPS